jgi:hypothetical protein
LWKLQRLRSPLLHRHTTNVMSAITTIKPDRRQIKYFLTAAWIASRYPSCTHYCRYPSPMHAKLFRNHSPSFTTLSY